MNYKKLEDNGQKWGSTVKQNPDGSFPYDSAMHKSRHKEWKSMMAERMAWAYQKEVATKEYTKKAPHNFGRRAK